MAGVGERILRREKPVKMLETYCSILGVDRLDLRKWCEENLSHHWQLDYQRVAGEALLLLTHEEDLVLARLRWSNATNKFVLVYEIQPTSGGDSEFRLKNNASPRPL